MYLTLLRLDPQSADARRDLADPYEMHRTLVRAFVADEVSQPPRFLWRLEPTATWSQPAVLVQSQAAGSWSSLSAAPGYFMQGEGPSEKHFESASLLSQSNRFRFRLAANPTVTRQGKRFGLVGEEAQLAWLRRQGERHGFELESALVTGSDTVHGGIRGRRLSVLKVVFEGFLFARDRDALADALVTGVGPAKAFGCGLLSLAPFR